MHETNVTGVVILFLCLGLFSPGYVAADDSESVWCSVFGWALEPMGFCSKLPAIVSEATVTPAKRVPASTVIEDELKNAPDTNTESELSLATTTVNQTITNEYVTVQHNGVSEKDLDERISEIFSYIDTLPLGASVYTGQTVSDRRSQSASREYVIKTHDSISDQIQKTVAAISDGGSFSNTILTAPSLSNAQLTGTSHVTGWLGVGSSTPSDVLSVDGPVYLSSVAPSNVTNRLYNSAGDLYWNGSVITGSTTANWTATAGDVYRSTGHVGIGTTTLSETLTVDGTVSAGTTTARIIDTGGEVCNVTAYGAVGDNATLNDAAIAKAIAACGEGGTVYFPLGEYRIANPIVLDRPVTLRGAYSPRWSYSSTPRSSIRADFASFSGVALIHVRDRAISGETEHNNGGRLESISLDGGSAGVNVDGIYFEGLVRDWKLTDVDISQVTGNGFEAAVGTGSGNPRGFTIRGLSIYSADGHGFRATALNDSYVEDLLSVGNALRGIYLSSMGETKINNSRAVFNGLTGLYIDGASANGGLMFTDFSTDRNDRHGVRISLTGTTTVTFNGLLTRRDGANTSGGTETPYAGVAVIGTTTEKVAPVFINGLTQIIGVDDVGAPPLAPLTGVRATNATYVKVEGQLWGVDNAFQDDGGNDNFIIEDGSIIKIGTDVAPDAAPTLFYDSWVATSTGLFFDGPVSLGSSTGSRLFNVTAEEQVGARFRDTTNNVTMDMRVEDFQGFIGTFSNHQLRFQTNNTSRLTIDTNGDIGIGTTTPDQTLDVDGVIQASSLLGGATNLTTDVNGNIIRDPSDERLKMDIVDVEDALDKVLALRGVSYRWRDADRFGAQAEIGFIAQEVEEIVPEVVQKGGDYWSLNTRNLLAVVVEAIEEMWQTVTGNQEKIAELEERLQILEAELDIESESAVVNEDQSEVRDGDGKAGVIDQNDGDNEVGVADVEDESGVELVATSTTNIPEQTTNGKASSTESAIEKYEDVTVPEETAVEEVSDIPAAIEAEEVLEINTENKDVSLENAIGEEVESEDGVVVTEAEVVVFD